LFHTYHPHRFYLFFQWKTFAQIAAKSILLCSPSLCIIILSLTHNKTLLISTYFFTQNIIIHLLADCASCCITTFVFAGDSRWLRSSANYLWYLMIRNIWKIPTTWISFYKNNFGGKFQGNNCILKKSLLLLMEMG